MDESNDSTDYYEELNKELVELLEFLSAEPRKEEPKSDIQWSDIADSWINMNTGEKVDLNNIGEGHYER